MIKVTVKINGKDYNLVGRENETYLKDLAAFVDSRIGEVKSKNPLLSLVDSAVLASVNIADDLYKTDVDVRRYIKENGQLIKENQEMNRKMKELTDEVEALKKSSDHINNENSMIISCLRAQIDA